MLTPENAEFIDLALEGTSSAAPRPNIPELVGVHDKLQEIALKAAKERAKASSGQSSGSRASRGRGGRSRGRGRGSQGSDKGKEPASQ